MPVVASWILAGAQSARLMRPRITEQVVCAGGEVVDAAIVEWSPEDYSPTFARGIDVGATKMAGGGRLGSFVQAITGFRGTPGIGAMFPGFAVDDALRDAGFEDEVVIRIGKLFRPGRSIVLEVVDRIDVLGELEVDGVLLYAMSEIPSEDAPEALAGFRS